MTATAPERYVPDYDSERDTARIMLARLLVRQADFLKHEVDPRIAADAARPLPDEYRSAG